VEDDVEIGANTTIDRGALDDTVIGRGTKLDDLVMVAHGTRLGPHGLMAAQSGIAGSTRVGAWATFAGQAGAAGHLTLGDRVVVAAKSAVFADLPERAFVAGIPADDHRRWKREQVALKRLPELLQRVRALEAKLGLGEGEET
jgi:UDP-3-O-[3-hydroxymyristoyl] glucosamine N-acyltransferase